MLTTIAFSPPASSAATRRTQGPLARFTDAQVSSAPAIRRSRSLWSNLNLELTTIFQQYRVIQAGRPKLMVAVPGYPNPGITPLKWKLSIPEAPNSNICQ